MAKLVGWTYWVYLDIIYLYYFCPHVFSAWFMVDSEVYLPHLSKNGGIFSRIAVGVFIYFINFYFDN